MKIDKDKLSDYFENLDGLDSDKMMSLVEKYLDDEAVEIFVDHIEDFYGVQDDDELGTLAQLMIAGFICAKEMEK